VNDKRAEALIELKRLHAIMRAATLEAEAIECDVGVVAIERAGLIIMCGRRMQVIQDTIRRITKGEEEVI